MRIPAAPMSCSLQCGRSPSKSSGRHLANIFQRSVARNITEAGGGGDCDELRPALLSPLPIPLYRNESVPDNGPHSFETQDAPGSSLVLHYSLRRFCSNNVNGTNPAIPTPSRSSAAFVAVRERPSRDIYHPTPFLQSALASASSAFTTASTVSLLRPVVSALRRGSLVSATVPATAASAAATPAPHAYQSTRSLFSDRVCIFIHRPTENCYSGGALAATAGRATSPVCSAAVARESRLVARRGGWLSSCCTTRVRPMSFLSRGKLACPSACNVLSRMETDRGRFVLSSSGRPSATTVGGSVGNGGVFLPSFSCCFGSFCRGNKCLWASCSGSIGPLTCDGAYVAPSQACTRRPPSPLCSWKPPHAFFASLAKFMSRPPSTLHVSRLQWIDPDASQVVLLSQVPLGRAAFSTAGDASSFDIFQRLKDPPGAQQQDEAERGATGKKRKPSDRVLRLVDEIMNLTLIEAADLCDLCQEKLAERSGGPTFNAAAAAGRTPFPHPAAMFAGMAMQGAIPAAIPAMGVAPAAATAPGAGQPGPTLTESEPSKSSKKPEKKDEAKATFSIKLIGFDAAKKVAVVKEVRAITALGLKESKDLVEQAPKILKKGVSAADAEVLKKKLEAAGAQVALE